MTCGLPNGCRPDGTAFSFNGGKDSTVLLHIIRAAVAQRCRAAAADAASNASSSNEEAANGAVSGDARPAPGNAAEPDALQRLHLADETLSNAPGGCGGMCTFVFERDDDFHEIRDFVAAMDRQYGLDVEVWMHSHSVRQAGSPENFPRRENTGVLSRAQSYMQYAVFQVLTGDFKAGLTQLVTRGGVRAIILGTRRSATALQPALPGLTATRLSELGFHVCESELHSFLLIPHPQQQP
jgi:hypothetical protein